MVVSRNMHFVRVLEGHLNLLPKRDSFPEQQPPSANKSELLCSCGGNETRRMLRLPCPFCHARRETRRLLPHEEEPSQPAKTLEGVRH